MCLHCEGNDQIAAPKAVVEVDQPMKALSMNMLLNCLLTVKAVPHDCVIRTGLP